MNITITPDEQSFDEVAARRIIGQIVSKKDSVICLSTGRTTGNMHRRIVEIYRDSAFDTSEVTITGVDEVVNVPKDYSGACYTMLRNEIAEGLEIKDENFIMLPTISDDFEKECTCFMKELERRGGIDLLILGLGENGHLGFNQPGTSFGSTARVTEMNAELEERIRRETKTPPEVWLGGVTLGLKDIMQAKKIILVAKGNGKAESVRKMIEGPLTEEHPASILRLHPDCEYLLDKAAASKLYTQKT